MTTLLIMYTIVIGRRVNWLFRVDSVTAFAMSKPTLSQNAVLVVIPEDGEKSNITHQRLIRCNSVLNSKSGEGGDKKQIVE